METGRYKIKYAYGIGYIRPYAITHPLHKQHQVIFATEKIYIFLRLYSLLILILSEAKLALEDTKTYHQILALLKSYKLEEISFKVYEMKCRTLSPSLVCKLAALPRLVEKCCDFFYKLVKEDVLLRLYDLSHFCSLDLTLLRTMSLDVTSEASYRIQYSPEEGKLCFMFLNFDTDMVVATPKSLLKEDVVMEEGFENAMVSRGPPSKRLKIKL